MQLVFNRAHRGVNHVNRGNMVNMGLSWYELLLTQTFNTEHQRYNLVVKISVAK